MTEKELHEYLKAKYPKENVSCEWKSYGNLKHMVAGKSGEDIVSYVSGIANNEGGHLVIGAEDQTLEIKGIISFHDYTPENLPYKIHSLCPNLSTEGLLVDAITTTDSGKTIWILHIPKHLPRQPVIAHNKAWQRVGDSLLSITPERKAAILNESNSRQADWSAQICPKATIDDLDPIAVERARSAYLSKYPDKVAEAEEWDDITFLNKAKITIKGEITNAAIVLLGRSESEHFISPSESKIRWILKGASGVEKDYRIFSCPFLLAVDAVFQCIRNLKYRYIKDPTTLFPDEVDQYDPYTIRESLNNCIAHQDYTLGGRINVVEMDSQLIFSNKGSFIPGSVETVIRDNAPEETYRNPFLAEAMVNLKMVDTIGSGIRRIFKIQRDKLFPLPDFDFSDRKVTVTITSKVLDFNYAMVLTQNPKLELTDIMMLDKVQKHKPLDLHEIHHLRAKRLIEGRKPNFHISSGLASSIDQKPEYILSKGLDDDYFKQLVQELLRKFGTAKRRDMETLLLVKLPDVLSLEQKHHRIKNLLQSMKKEGRIKINSHREWELDHPLGVSSLSELDRSLLFDGLKSKFQNLFDDEASSDSERAVVE